MVIRLLTALVVGLVVGLERSYSGKTVGYRAFTAFALAGALSTIYGGPVLTPLTTAIFLTVPVALVVRSFRGKMYFGSTTAAALMMVFVLGQAVGRGEVILGIVGSTVGALLLYSRFFLHSLADRLSDGEVRGAIYFGTLAGVVYPALPDRFVDPLGLVNPKTVVLVIVLVSSIGFVNLVVMRFVAPERGLSVSGLLGGLVHSEATAGAIATQVRGREELLSGGVRGVLLANAAMLLRNLAVGVAIDYRLALYLAAPLIAEAVVLAALSLRNVGGSGGVGRELELESPFSLRPAFKFGAVFLALMVATGLARTLFGEGGVLGVAVLGGVAYAGAITASVATLSLGGQITAATASKAIISTSAVAILNKPIYIALTGNARLARRTAAPVLGASLALLVLLAIELQLS